MNRQIVLQILRTPVLLALLVLLGPWVRTWLRAVARVDEPTAARAWVVIVAAVLVFAVVALLGRATKHPPAVLVVEAVVAGLFGLVPPWIWINWVGAGGLPMVTGLTTGNLVVPMLALAWFAIVATTGVRQWQAARRRPGAGASVAADAGRAG